MSARPGPCGGQSAMVVPTAISQAIAGVERRTPQNGHAYNLYLSVQLRRPFPAACFLVVARPLARPLLSHPLAPGVSSCGRPGGSRRVHPGCGQVAGRGRWRHDRGRGDVDRYGVLPGARAASRHGRARGLDCARVAMAEIITTIALPSVPPVSRFSRKLTNSIWSRPSSSNTSKKWRVERASRSESPDHHHLETSATGVPQQSV